MRVLTFHTAGAGWVWVLVVQELGRNRNICLWNGMVTGRIYAGTGGDGNSGQ